MDKYLRVMADYSSTGLWNKDGSNVDVGDYALSPETVKALSDWCDLYETNDDYLEESDRKHPMFDLQAFSAQGLDVAKAIKRDLPDYNVIYFDEFKLTTVRRTWRDRLAYEYPINL